MQKKLQQVIDKLNFYSPSFKVDEIKYKGQDTGCSVYDVKATNTDNEPKRLYIYGAITSPMVIGTKVSFYRIFIPN